MELHAYLKASVHIYVCVSAPGLKGSLGEHMEWWVKKVCRWWGTETSLTQHSGCWITARRFHLSAFNTPRWVEHTKTRTTYLRISEICFIGPQRFYAVFKKVENDFNLPFKIFFKYTDRKCPLRGMDLLLLCRSSQVKKIFPRFSRGFQHAVTLQAVWTTGNKMETH